MSKSKTDSDPVLPAFPEIPHNKGAFDITWDIETSPLPEDRLRMMLPAFNPEDVKLGNTKDPEKVAAKIEEARANHWTDFQKRAALDAKTGFVMAFGFAIDDGPPQLALAETLEEERALLQWITDLLHWWNRENGYLIGFNVKAFDLRFLIQRMWIQALRRPAGLIQSYRGRMYWDDRVRDLLEEWMLPFNREYTGNGLDAVCKAVIGEGKSGDHGAHFYKLIVEDREAAITYAKTDVFRTQQLNRAMFGNRKDRKI